MRWGAVFISDADSVAGKQPNYMRPSDRTTRSSGVGGLRPPRYHRPLDGQPRQRPSRRRDGQAGRRTAHSDTDGYQGQRIIWIEGCDVVSGDPVWVPHEMVHLDFTMPLPPGSGHFSMGSNGLASGNHLVEALAHAVFELIERDATTLFYQLSWERQWERRLDPRSIDDPSCAALL